MTSKSLAWEPWTVAGACEAIVDREPSSSHASRLQAAHCISSLAPYNCHFQLRIKERTAREELCVINGLLWVLEDILNLSDKGKLKTRNEQMGPDSVLAGLYGLTRFHEDQDIWNENAKHLRGKMGISPHFGVLARAAKEERLSSMAKELQHRAKTIVKEDKAPLLLTISLSNTDDDDMGPRIRKTLRFYKRNCEECGKTTTQICSKCHSLVLCSAECSKKYWPKHKTFCVRRPPFLETQMDIYANRQGLADVSLYDFYARYEVPPVMI